MACGVVGLGDALCLVRVELLHLGLELLHLRAQRRRLISSRTRVRTTRVRPAAADRQPAGDGGAFLALDRRRGQVEGGLVAAGGPGGGGDLGLAQEVVRGPAVPVHHMADERRALAAGPRHRQPKLLRPLGVERLLDGFGLGLLVLLEALDEDLNVRVRHAAPVSGAEASGSVQRHGDDAISRIHTVLLADGLLLTGRVHQLAEVGLRSGLALPLGLRGLLLVILDDLLALLSPLGRLPPIRGPVCRRSLNGGGVRRVEAAQDGLVVLLRRHPTRRFEALSAGCYFLA